MIDNYIFDKDYLSWLKKNKSFKEYNKIINNLNKIIHSDNYLLLLKEYKELINNITYLFKELKIYNPLEVAILFNDLLFDGYFSMDKEFDIIDNSKYDLLVKTWGSRVCIGECVCRHSASLLVDIERNLGNISECVDMISVNKNNLIKQKLVANGKLTDVNHLVVGLQYDNNIYLYDPNNYYFLFKKDDLNKDIIDFVGLEKTLKQYDKIITYFNSKTNDNEFDFNRVLPLININVELISKINDKITEIYSKNEQLLNDFYFDNSKKIRKIAYLNNEIILQQKQYK